MDEAVETGRSGAGGGTREAAPGVWRLTTPLPFRPREVHAHLARLDGGGWMLVDGGLGTEEGWAALDAGVRAVAGGWAEVALLVVTHMHMDHVGLAARARAASGAPVAMGALDAERMAHAHADPDDEAAYREALLRRCGAPAEFVAAVQAGRRRAAGLTPPVAVDRELEGEGGELPGAPGWRWVWTPGHTAGHVSLLRESDRLLVAGDAVLPAITPTIGVNRQRPDPVGDYLGALRRLEALRPSLVLPGHGDPIADPAARLAGLRDATREETAEVLALLPPEGATVWEAAERRYAGRDLPAGARTQALRETRAHLLRLEAEGRVAVERDAGGADRFRPAS